MTVNTITIYWRYSQLQNKHHPNQTRRIYSNPARVCDVA